MKAAEKNVPRKHRLNPTKKKILFKVYHMLLKRSSLGSLLESSLTKHKQSFEVQPTNNKPIQTKQAPILIQAASINVKMMNTN